MRTIFNKPANEFADHLADMAVRAGAVDAACITPAFFNPAPLAATFDAWLCCGNGHWLPYIAKNCEPRTSPFVARPWATSAVVILFRNQWNCLEAASAADAVAPIPPGLPVVAASSHAPVGRVAAYAAGVDYHKTGRTILETIARELAGGMACRTELAVDTAPLPDTFMGLAAGLGRRGINGLLRTSQFGTRVFVGTVFSNLPLPLAIHTPEHLIPACDDCRVCLRACPTNALTPGDPLAVQRCRSYLSMEYRRAFNADQLQGLGDALFGCDACTAACPPQSGPDTGQTIDVVALLHMASNQIKHRIQGTALAYAGPTLLKRNAIANLANSGHPDAKPLIGEVRKSTNSAVVAATADVALEML